MQTALDTLSERVERLQLEVIQHQCDTRYGSLHYRSRQRNPTPDTERCHCCHHCSRINTSTEILVTTDTLTETADVFSSCDQYLGHDRSYRPPRFDRDKHNRRDFHTCSGSSESAMQEATAPPLQTTQGMAALLNGNHHFPSPGHVMFQSRSCISSNKVNYN